MKQKNIINVKNIKNVKKDTKNMKKTKKDTEILKNFTKEEEIDKEMQEMLVFCENLENYEINDDLKNLVGYYFLFSDKRIEHLEDLQKSFGLQNNKKRLTDIVKYLDAYTLGEQQHSIEEDFSNKISLLLDLLYSVRIILRNFHISNFVKPDVLDTINEN